MRGLTTDRANVPALEGAAVAAGVERFVSESAIGVGDSRDKLPLLFRLPLFGLLAAKNRSEATLRTLDLDHTIPRPGRLTDGPPTGDVLVGEGGLTVAGSIPRADVARLLVASLSTPDARNRTFEVVSRDGLRGPARGLVDLDWQ